MLIYSQRWFIQWIDKIKEELKTLHAKITVHYRYCKITNLYKERNNIYDTSDKWAETTYSKHQRWECQNSWKDWWSRKEVFEFSILVSFFEQREAIIESTERCDFECELEITMKKHSNTKHCKEKSN